MKSEHQIIQTVYAAKDDLQKADDLIRDYLPLSCQKHLNVFQGSARSRMTNLVSQCLHFTRQSWDMNVLAVRF